MQTSFARGWLAALLAVVLAAVPGVFATQGSGSETEVSSMLTAGIVKLGSSVGWKVRVDGTQKAEIVEVPRVPGLRIEGPGNPSLRSLISRTPTRTISVTSIEWMLRVTPDDVGEYTIPPLKLSVDGREFSTDELSLKVVRDLRGESLGYFEIETPPLRVYEGQPFLLDLHFGWEGALNVGSARLVLPWWGQLRGVLETATGERDLSTKEVAFGLNSRSQIRVEEVPGTTRDGRTFRSFRLRRGFLASRPGTLDIPESYLEFVQLVEGSSPFGSQELEEYYVHLPAFRIEVLPIPEEGRPFEWSGAVGDFRAERRVDRRDVDAGESIKLTVSWLGQGNLEFFEPPDVTRLPEFAGFRCLGTESEFLGDERRVTYDLVPMSSEITEIPSVTLWVFDTTTESFRKVETESVPIRVRAPLATSTLTADGETGPVSDIRDIEPRPVSGGELDRPGAGVVGAVLVVVPAAWLVARTIVRRRRGDPDAPALRERRRARRALARDLGRARTPADQSAALERFLAARTREAEQAWLGRDPLEWAREQGRTEPSNEALRSLAEILRELDEQAWGRGGGEPAPLPRERILAVADSLVRGGL